MWLVVAALRRPITVLVIVLAIVLGAWLAVRQMPVDIFPNFGLPVIYVAQPYGGMDPAQMEGYVTFYYEYHFLYITGIEHVESKSIQGASIIKLQFYPGTDMSQAMSETVAYVNRARAFMPPGTVPPFIMRFDAGSVPVGNLVFSSETRSVGEMQDLALNRVRPLFATLPGEQRAHPVQSQVLHLAHRARFAGKDQVAHGHAPRVKAHDERRHGAGRHEGAGAIHVGHRLRHRLGHVRAGIELQLDNRRALDRFRFD